jgi:hypothetical protein
MSAQPSTAVACAGSPRLVTRSRSAQELDGFAIQAGVAGRVEEGPAQFQGEFGIDHRDLQHVRKLFRGRSGVGLLPWPAKFFGQPREPLEKGASPNAQAFADIPLVFNEGDRRYHCKRRQGHCRKRPNRAESQKVHTFQHKPRGNRKGEELSPWPFWIADF